MKDIIEDLENQGAFTLVEILSVGNEMCSDQSEMIIVLQNCLSYVMAWCDGEIQMEEVTVLEGIMDGFEPMLSKQGRDFFLAMHRLLLKNQPDQLSVDHMIAMLAAGIECTDGSKKKTAIYAIFGGLFAVARASGELSAKGKSEKKSFLQEVCKFFGVDYTSLEAKL